MSFVKTAAGKGIIPEAHSSVAYSHLVGFKNTVTHLIENKQLPENGLSEAEIRHLLTELALSDSNNFPGKVGAGEREGRVISRLVQDRHFNLTHGIGRSGNIRDPQPKAAGSSIICQVTDGLALDATRAAGIKEKVQTKQ